MKLRPPSISGMNIIDDFLDKDYHQQLLSILNGWEFPWYYQETLTRGSRAIQAHGFNHWLTHEDSPVFGDLVASMQQAINATECFRVRADMTLYNPEGYRHEFHVDSEDPHMVCIYYCNDSDGDTIILGDPTDSRFQRIQPKANRLLIFNGQHMHTGHSPSRHKNRILINANFSTY